MAKGLPSGPITRKEVKRAGSLRKVYEERAELGDEKAKEVVKRVAKSSMQTRQKEPGTSVFHQRTKLISEVFED